MPVPAGPSGEQGGLLGFELLVGQEPTGVQIGEFAELVGGAGRAGNLLDVLLLGT